MFDFYYNTRVKFGSGCKKALFDILGLKDWKNVGVVVDHHLFGIELIDEFLNKLEKYSNNFIIGKCDLSEPTYDSLEIVRRTFLGNKIDVFVGIGGGECLGYGKSYGGALQKQRTSYQLSRF